MSDSGGNKKQIASRSSIDDEDDRRSRRRQEQSASAQLLEEGNVSNAADTSTSVRAQHEGGSIEAAAFAAADTSSGVARAEASQSSSSSQGNAVIAVSASKSPTVFFNLARKFLLTEETVMLSALEGAIVSAVDAAHLLERSRLATIERVETSYVAVEPKRRRNRSGSSDDDHRSLAESMSASSRPFAQHTNIASSSNEAVLSSTGGGASKIIENDYLQQKQLPRDESSGQGSKWKQEQRRARIKITLRRTPDYTQWLVDNPHGSGDDDTQGDNN